MGAWLRRNGEAVYGTRAWNVYGEGPTQMGSDHFSDMIAGTAEDIRFTRNKENTVLYATILGWPENGQVKIKSLGSDKVSLDDLTQAVLLVDENIQGVLLNYVQEKEELIIQLPKQKPIEQEAYVIKLDFKERIPKS